VTLVELGAFVLLAVGLTGLIGLVVPRGLVWGGLALLVGTALPGWLLLAREGRPPATLGLPLDRRVPIEVAGGLLLGGGAAGMVVLTMAVLGAVAWVPDEGGAVAFLTGGAALLAVLALPALAEEVALRGYLLQAAARGFGPGWALLGTSVLFGLMHLGNPRVGPAGVLGIVAAGLMLGALVLRTGALWWASGAHLGWNWALAWPADLPVSGLDLGDTPGLDAQVTGAPWLTGGAFGPEASVLAVGVLGALAARVWWGRGFQPVEGRPPPLYAVPEVVEPVPSPERARGTINEDGVA
jgi:uncharacterized protein